MGHHATHHFLHHLQIGGAVLYQCRVEECSRADGTVQSMLLSGIRSIPSLQQLLAAALPDGAQLCSLRLLHSPLSKAAVRHCTFLGHLTGLILHFCSFSDDRASPVVKALLRQAPRLASLKLGGCFQGDKQRLPSALVSHTGLLHLDLKYNELTRLDPGPYLASEWQQSCLPLFRGLAWLGVAARAVLPPGGMRRAASVAAP